MAEKRNPWLPEPIEEPDQNESGTQNTDEAVTPVTGPTAPQGSVLAPAPLHWLPTANYDMDPELWVVGVHGGAGESSLAALSDRWETAEHCWPVMRSGGTSHVVLVARLNLQGLHAAQKAAEQWASGNAAPSVQVHGLVFVADSPGSPPRPIRDYAQVVAGGLPRIWWVPWVEAWRADPPSSANAPRKAKKLVRDLEKIINGG